MKLFFHFSISKENPRQLEIFKSLQETFNDEMYNRLKYYLPLQYGNKEFIVPFLLVLKRIKCDKDSEENYKIKLEFHTDPTEQSVKGMAETKEISSFVQNLIEFTFDTIKEFQNYREALLVKVVLKEYAYLYPYHPETSVPVKEAMQKSSDFLSNEKYDFIKTDGFFTTFGHIFISGDRYYWEVRNQNDNNPTDETKLYDISVVFPERDKQALWMKILTTVCAKNTLDGNTGCKRFLFVSEEQMSKLLNLVKVDTYEQLKEVNSNIVVHKVEKHYLEIE